MGRTEVDNANPPDNSLSSGKHGLFGQPFCVGFPFFELVIFSLSISVYVCMYKANKGIVVVVVEQIH